MVANDNEKLKMCYVELINTCLLDI